MEYIFNVGDVVEVIDDVNNENKQMVGITGIVRDVIVGSDSNTLYGIEIVEGNKNIDKEEMCELNDFLLYFLARELELR